MKLFWPDPGGSVELSSGLTQRERDRANAWWGLGVSMDKSSVTLATLLLFSALVRMLRWQKGLYRLILLCVPSFFIRETLCKQLPSIDSDVSSELCTFPC